MYLYNYYWVRIKLSLTICLFCFTVKGQHQTFTPDQLKEDLQFLKDAIEKYNPAHYQYNQKDKFAALYEKIIDAINSPLTHLEFFKAVSLLSAASNEGHFVVGNAGNKVTGIYSGFIENRFKLLPARLYFGNEKAYIHRDYSQTYNLPAKAQVLEINGKLITKIVNHLLPYIASDGDIQTSKIRRLNKEFNALYFWFVDQPQAFKLKLKTKDPDSVFTVVVSASTRDDMMKYSAERYGKTVIGPLCEQEVYEIHYDKSYTLLKLKSFNSQLIEKYKLNAKSFYKDLFVEIWKRKTNNLR